MPNNKNINNKRRKQNCNYQDLWLIPGKADASCSKNCLKVKIRPSIIKFPGCFTVEIRNIHIVDDNGLPNSIFAKTEYQWLNVRGSEKAKCQNSSSNGCGGFGNNCYYCDICESLKKVDKQNEREDGNELLPSNIAQQLKGIKCPSEPGLYTFRKQFCFNDWQWLDNDGDCQLDILSETDDQSGIKIAMSALQQVGYGTIVTKIRLAFNATPEIERKKAIKEAQIERNSLREFEQKIKNVDSNIPFNEVKIWYIEQQKNIWHKNDYLPWLLYENEFACIRLTFDVCERQPLQRWEGGFTCA
uniref:DUF7753 domain-containing protein n=1 Tax=Meloidogyne incognita TaxID=6306 RepID=A0A914MZ41_MELIC